MRRPTRTRRLSITALISLTALVSLGGLGARSFWNWDAWGTKNNRMMALGDGCIIYMHTTGTGPSTSVGYLHGDVQPDDFEYRSVLGFIFSSDFTHDHPPGVRTFEVHLPLWFPILLLLIAPLRWLIARPANAPAFPVITDATQK